MTTQYSPDLDMSAAQAVRLYLIDRLAEFETIADRLVDPDPAVVIDAVHDLRVICRQILSCLHAFSPYLKVRRLRTIDRGIRHVNEFLGPLRDLDILLMHDELNNWLRAALEHKRADALSALLQECSGKPLHEQISSMTRPLLQPDADIRLSPPAISANGRVQLRQLRLVVPEILYRLAAEVTAYQSVVRPSDQDLPRAEVLHRLRISCKQFRYTVTMMRPMFDRHADGLIQSFKDLQDLLGRLHDQEMLIQAIAGQKKTAATETPAPAVWSSIQKMYQLLLTDFFAIWPHCDQAWLHRQIRPLLDSIYPVDDLTI